MACVSIITPLYNSSRFVVDAVRSVQAQSFSDWEMIIVDDLSTDESVAIVEDIAQSEHRIRLTRLDRNCGAAVARNAAIKLAKGRYIAFLDSDDVWLPDKLEKQVAFMQENRYPFVFSAYERIDEKGKCFGRVGVPDRVSYRDLLKTCSIGCLTAVYDAEMLGKVYMPLIRKRQDLGLWLKLLKTTDYAYGQKEVLAKYRVRGDSISSNKANAAKFTWQLYRNVERLDLFRASYYFSHYAVRGLLRTKVPRIARLLGVAE